MLPVMGFISDRVTYQKVMRYACLAIFLGAFLIPYFLHMQFFIMTIISLALIISAFNGPTPAFINNLFPPNIRYTGISVGFSLGTALFGSLCPLIFTFLTKYFESVFILTPCFLLISGIGFYSVSASLNVRAKLEKSSKRAAVNKV
jgi:MHS family proline/betaine transporter-like MFS transporter